MTRHDPHAAFQADCVRNADQMLVRFSGRLVLDPEAGPHAWQSCLERSTSSLVSLDLGAVTSMDASGVGLLAEFVRAVRAQGRRLALVAAHPRVLKMLELTRLDTLIDGGVSRPRCPNPRLAA